MFERNETESLLNKYKSKQKTDSTPRLQLSNTTIGNKVGTDRKPQERPISSTVNDIPQNNITVK